MRSTIAKFLTTAAVAGLVMVSGGRAEAQQHHGRGTGQGGGGARDIVQVATGAGTFQTLLAAAQAAGLVETLKGDGPLTVFAPTDAAFARLPAGTVDALLRDPEKLRAILTYHVVPGRVTAAQVVRLDEAKTVNGASVDIRTVAGVVKVNEAVVVTPDVMASNGVIHVIDRVLLPPM